MGPHEVRSIGMRIQDRVRAQFSWPLESDRESAMMLLQSVNSLSSKVPDWTVVERENSIVSLQERLLNGPIAAVGAAVESDEILSALKSNHRFIFADGSIGIIQEFENEIREEIWSQTLALVTDADGHPHISQAAEREIMHILHAHGDNEDDWAKLVKEISKMNKKLTRKFLEYM